MTEIVTQPIQNITQTENVLRRYTDKFMTMHSALENIPIDIIHEYLIEGQLFAPENFEENYSKWPQEIKNRWEYEPVKMSIDDTEEIVGYTIHKKYTQEPEPEKESESESESESEQESEQESEKESEQVPSTGPPPIQTTDQVEKISEEVKKSGNCLQQ
jgi:hypothetical protein